MGGGPRGHKGYMGRWAMGGGGYVREGTIEGTPALDLRSQYNVLPAKTGEETAPVVTIIFRLAMKSYQVGTGTSLGNQVLPL